MSQDDYAKDEDREYEDDDLEDEDEDDEDEDDDDDDSEEFDKFLQFMMRLRGQAMARLESQLLQLGKLYDALEDEQQAKLIQWIDEVEAVYCKRSDSIPCDVGLLIWLMNVHKKEGTLCLPSLALKNALAAWKRGDKYSPNTKSEWFNEHLRNWPKE